MKKRLISLFFLILSFIMVNGQALAASAPSPTTVTDNPAHFQFEPSEPHVDTRKSIELTLQGASGELTWHAEKGTIEGSGNTVTYTAPGNPIEDRVTVTDAAGETAVLPVQVTGFLDLQLEHVFFLFIVGFVGGLVSGFIGSGGAFVLTPAMMSMGVPAIMAVASNMCHKFPKALVGSMKRARYGQVDVKLGIIMGISAEAGVLYGATVQQQIRDAFGPHGSNLYVSVVFVVVLAIVGGYVLRDAWILYREGSQEAKLTKIAKWVQSVRIPGTMMYFKSIGTEISVLFTIPLGFATGMLAATIAVGGFIGVPAMMYILGVPGLMASATELVIAFLMGMGGTIKYALSGFVDIRLAMIILAGSLFGVQLGAIGTTYVKDYMIKIVMGTVMMLVLLSRGFMVPVYLARLDYIEPLSPTTTAILENISFFMLVSALSVGAIIILWALIRGFAGVAKAKAAEEAVEAEATELPSTLSPTGRLERILLVTDGSEFSNGAEREAIHLAQKANARLYAMSVVMVNPDYESLAPQVSSNEEKQVQSVLDTIQQNAQTAGVNCETNWRRGSNAYEEIINEAKHFHVDLIVMGRRGKSGLMRLMMGSTTERVIGFAECNVLIVPRASQIKGDNLLVAVDGSRYGDIAAATAVNYAKYLDMGIHLVSVSESEQDHVRKEAKSIVDRVSQLVDQQSVKVKSEVLSGKPANAIVQIAKEKEVNLIVMGSHGRTGWDKVLMGSVSDRVIGHAQASVLVVKS